MTFVQSRTEADVVIEEAGFSGHGGEFFAKKREAKLCMCAVRVEARCEAFQEGVDLVDVQFGAFCVNGFDEPAHVSAFEGGGEVDGEFDSGDRVLFRLCFVADAHRETKTFDSDAVDGYLPVIRLVLGVFEVREGQLGHLG